MKHLYFLLFVGLLGCGDSEERILELELKLKALELELSQEKDNESEVSQLEHTEEKDNESEQIKPKTIEKGSFIVEQYPVYSSPIYSTIEPINFDQSPATQLNPAQAATQKILNIAANNIDNTHYNKPYTFDGATKARIKKKYGQEVYDRKGFDPKIDNEAWFKQK